MALESTIAEETAQTMKDFDAACDDAAIGVSDTDGRSSARLRSLQALLWIVKDVAIKGKKLSKTQYTPIEVQELVLLLFRMALDVSLMPINRDVAMCIAGLVDCIGADDWIAWVRTLSSSRRERLNVY